MRVPPSVVAALLSVLSLANGQTFTACDPTKKTCPADPALGKTITTDFTKGKSKDWVYADGTEMTYNANGANFIISNKKQAPTLLSEKYIFFGQISATIKASPGQGIVSAFILQSDDLDEIDWEWLGGVDDAVQTNVFGRGTNLQNNLASHGKVASAQEEWHTYKLDWTESAIKWYIDDVLIRTVRYTDYVSRTGSDGINRYPQTPMQVKMGSWIGCADAAAAANPKTKGTCNWSGGPADWSKAPFNMLIKSVTIQDYGCASEYVYGDKSGTYKSIKSVGTCERNSPTTTKTSSTSTKSSSTSSKSSSTSAKTSTTSTKTSTTSAKSSSTSSSSENHGTTTTTTTTSTPGQDISTTSTSTHSSTTSTSQTACTENPSTASDSSTPGDTHYTTLSSTITVTICSTDSYSATPITTTTTVPDESESSTTTGTDATYTDSSPGSSIIDDSGSSTMSGSGSITATMSDAASSTATDYGSHYTASDYGSHYTMSDFGSPPVSSTGLGSYPTTFSSSTMTTNANPSGTGASTPTFTPPPNSAQKLHGPSILNFNIIALCFGAIYLLI